MSAPAFQLYADDFIGGTVCLSAEDVGAYIRLLCYQWGNGSIPDRKTVVDRVAGCVVSDEVLAKFPDGINPRLAAEHQKHEDYRAKCAASGKVGGGNPNFVKGAKNPYYSTKDKPPLSLPLCSKDKGRDKGEINSPISDLQPPISDLRSSISNLQSNTESAKALSVCADEIYRAYPKKVGKPAAIKSILKALSGFPPDVVLSKTKEYAASRAGQDDQYTPHPSTWFNEHRFNDEPSTWKIAGKPAPSKPESRQIEETFPPKLI